MTGRADGSALEGVSATTLWTLRNRAEGALRTPSLIDDPLAVELYRNIDYDFEMFGPPSQSHPLRATTIDNTLDEYLQEFPRASVVNLGEGLQTGFWRTDSDEVTWLSVDLPPVIELRRTLLPRSKQIREYPMSALDRRWLDDVDPTDGVFIIAEGLFMYLDPTEVWSLIDDCARRFPGGQLIFDSIPAWFSRKTIRGLKMTERYQAPPMPFSLSVDQAQHIPDRIPAVSEVRDVMLALGQGVWGSSALRMLSNVPVLRNHRPSLTLATFTSE